MHPAPTSSLALQPVLKWLETQLHRALTVDSIASYAALSRRTLNRRFLEQTGKSPLHWIRNARVRRAQHLLETSALSIEQVAQATGFGSGTSLRHWFNQRVGTSPQHYRNQFRHGGATAIASLKNPMAVIDVKAAAVALTLNSRRHIEE